MSYLVIRTKIIAYHMLLLNVTVGFQKWKHDFQGLNIGYDYAPDFDNTVYDYVISESHWVKDTLIIWELRKGCDSLN